jgi:7,8-dihydropterin-6-yl-methyl-4-(beta-D-ribofuranosyl)aminobenzene 5'-phosphate synthase
MLLGWSVCRLVADQCSFQTAVKGETRRTLLFDTGPEEDIWERNVKRLKPNLAAIDRIHLSHWHRDHSGIV